MPLIKVRVKQTGQTGTMDSSEFDPNVFEQVTDQPTTPVQNDVSQQFTQQKPQPESRNPIADELAKKGLLGQLLSGVVGVAERPARFLGGSGLALGLAPAALMGNKQASDLLLSGDLPGLTKEQESILRGQDTGKVAVEGLRSGSDLASLLMPVGKGAQAFTSGAARGLSGVFGQRGTDASAADYLLGGATGGLTEGVIANALPFLKQKLSKGGKALQEGVVKPEVPATPTYSSNVEDLMNTKSQLGLKGSARNQLDQLDTAFKNTESTIKGLVKNAPGVPRSTAKADFIAELEKTDYLGNKKIYREAIDAYTKRLDNAAQTAEGLYNLKSTLRGELNTALKKLETGNANLSPTEEVKLAMYRGLKNTMDNIPGLENVRPLNSLEHSMFDLSVGLVKSSKAPGGIQLPIVGKVGGQGLQGLQDVIGTSLQGLSNAVPNAGPLSSILGKAANIGISNAPTVPVQQQEAFIDRGIQMPETQVPTAQQETGAGQVLTPEIMQQARLVLNDKDFNKLKQIYDLQESTGGSKLPAAQVTALSDLKNSQGMMDSLNKDIKAGSFDDILDPVKGLVGSLNPYDTKAKSFEAKMVQYAQIVGKAMEGGVLRQEDVVKYRKILPQITDTKEVALNKIKNVSEMLSTQRNAQVQGYKNAGYNVGE